jgi:hypothetical protein
MFCGYSFSTMKLIDLYKSLTIAFPWFGFDPDPQVCSIEFSITEAVLELEFGDRYSDPYQSVKVSDELLRDLEKNHQSILAVICHMHLNHLGYALFSDVPEEEVAEREQQAFELCEIAQPYGYYEYPCDKDLITCPDFTQEYKNSEKDEVDYVSAVFALFKLVAQPPVEDHLQDAV